MCNNLNMNEFGFTFYGITNCLLLNYMSTNGKEIKMLY